MKQNLGFWIAISAGVGAALGTVFGNTAIGIAVGAGIGVAFGAVLSQQKKNDDEE